MATPCVSIETPYTARYRVTGKAEWTCPFCGHHNETRIGTGVAYMNCKGQGCGRRFGNGHVFYVPIGAARFKPRVTPPDYIIPLAECEPKEAVPSVAVMREPAFGAPFHAVVTDASLLDGEGVSDSVTIVE